MAFSRGSDLEATHPFIFPVDMISGYGAGVFLASAVRLEEMRILDLPFTHVGDPLH